MIKSIRGVIRELIGRVATVQRNYLTWWRRRKDVTQVDAEFWDKARRCKAKGLEISGLLLKPVTSKIAAWAMGKAPTIVMEKAASQEAINDWWQKNHADILRGYQDSLDLADIYLVVNPDLSITIVPPHVVQRVVDENDFSQVIGWKIVEDHPHPEIPGRMMTIEDTYTDTERTRVKKVDGVTMSTERFPNLLGINPVVHIANNVGTNQIYGVPECEAMIPALHEYGEVFEAGLFGNKLQGRGTPTLSFKDTAALEKFMEDYATTETKTLEDGTTETYQTIPFDADKLMAVVGDFKYAQPGSSAGDTEKLLGLLYLLFLEHTELPEFVLGTAVASSKASVETQMPVFVKFIEKKQGNAKNWVLQLVQVALGYLALTTPGVAVDEATIQWEPLTEDDGQLTMQALQWAYGEGLLDDETALRLTPLDVEDIPGVLQKAREEREARDAARQEMDLQIALGQEQARMQGEDEDEDELDKAA